MSERWVPALGNEPVGNGDLQLVLRRGDKAPPMLIWKLPPGALIKVEYDIYPPPFAGDVIALPEVPGRQRTITIEQAQVECLKAQLALARRTLRTTLGVLHYSDELQRLIDFPNQPRMTLQKLLRRTLEDTKP